MPPGFQVPHLWLVKSQRHNPQIQPIMFIVPGHFFKRLEHPWILISEGAPGTLDTKG